MKWWGVFAYLILLGLSAAFPFFNAIERYSQGTAIQVPAFDFKGNKVEQLDYKIPVRAHLHGVTGRTEAQQGASESFRENVIVYLHRVPWDRRGHL